MFISALLIVKNEVHNLPRWLKDMRSVADELVVVDTGSSDDSVKIATAGGARVIAYEWQDDFAAARNFALQHVKGEVVIFLDADEYFPAEMLKKIRLLIRRYFVAPAPHAGLLGVRIDVDSDNQDKFIDSSFQCRIFRRQLRYQGSIHETLVIPQGMQLTVVRELYFYHTGYSSGRIKEKLSRNLSYLQKKQAAPDYREQPMDYRYLLDCYYGLGDMEKALEISELCLQKFGDRLQGVIFEIYRCRAKAAIFAARPVTQVLEILEEARLQAGFPLYFTLLTGLYLHTQGEREAALSYLSVGLESVDAPDIGNPIYELLPTAQKILASAL